MSLGALLPCARGRLQKESSLEHSSLQRSSLRCQREQEPGEGEAGRGKIFQGRKTSKSSQASPPEPLPRTPRRHLGRGLEPLTRRQPLRPYHHLLPPPRIALKSEVVYSGGRWWCVETSDKPSSCFAHRCPSLRRPSMWPFEAASRCLACWRLRLA